MLLGLGGATVVCDAPARKDDVHEDITEIVNWSGTKSVSSARYFQPETLEELKQIVAQANAERRKLRPIGSALSPNGLGFQEEGMVNLALMDNVLAVDTAKMQIRVQAGARVSQIVEALRPYGLTLSNFASISEQQIGGFIQVGAHGTGAKIPTVDEQVVALKLITPAAGEIDLSIDDDDPALFRLARTSLGMLGVVAEVTLQCVEAHRLLETTEVVTREEVRQSHRKWLAENRHLRYMWIPHSDSVVVVKSNLFQGDDDALRVIEAGHAKLVADQSRLLPAQKLLLEHPDCKVSKDVVMTLSFMELRSELLKLDPLNCEWVRRVNEVEAKFWKMSTGSHVDWSDRILQFDCGGQQWVSEVAFPVEAETAELTDVKYVEDVLNHIESTSVPAPAPIEQRWTSPSSSPLSAAGEKPTKELAPLYSWVGVIMYLPDADGTESCAESRENITAAFRSYKRACEKFWPAIHGVEHWAKIEMPSSDEERLALQVRMAKKYPLDVFNAVRALMDPNQILGSPLMSVILDGATVVQGGIMTSSPAQDKEK